MTPADIHVTNALSIPLEALTFSYIRASGPGGQNVNKVATAAQLRFDAANCAAVSPDLLERLRRVAGRRMTADGVVVITAQRFRSQERNREDAIGRLVDLLKKASHRPKARRPTKPSKAVKERRLEGKRQRSNIKKGRGRSGGVD